ncbi:TonB-dependent receptor family protein [Methylophaga sp. OBS3]|uniref:TonB-dependent receptor family protein n=1 Tax=Methylophaga sp. OBS3 TaxID=2991934 RepID=UPI00224D4976|nr:TonB-dependent receptor [Methylophaga sp. OBS3]MCX4190546.1 TonB-dependent receptor [Methylophaga sp. OBS3]
MIQKKLVAAMAAVTLSSVAFSVSANDVQALDSVTVIGSGEAARSLPGSAYYVGNEQLTTEATTDINQVMKTVPGVYIMEEDGLGLRPNIGIRAAAPERSSNITLMEDGVLIAPAPYSNPAAYYFPTAMRMHSIDILKGAPLLRYGPQTVGGVVNLVSTPIPDHHSGRAMFMLSDEGSFDTHAYYGGKEGGFGYLLETVQRNNEGFKDIDRSGRDSGFEIQDYVGKLSWEDERNKVLFKFQRSFEDSNETYAGLTDADFRRDENRRYGLTSIDNMDNDHTGVNLSHTFKWSDSFSSNVTLYHNEFNRNWFKFNNTGNLIDAANNGDANAQAVLDGTQDYAGLQYKNNNREYDSYGAQLNFNWLVGAHDFNFGVRQHFDETDRFQPVDTYDQINGQLVYQGTNASTVSGGDNRLEEAQALSMWITDNFQVTERLLLSASLRMEDVETKERRYTDPSRSEVVEGSRIDNDYREFLPGISATYDLTDNWQVLAGYHEGMIPLSAGSTDGDKPGLSDNYELGLRFQQGVFYSEAIGFYSDFSNFVEQCSVASPCSNGNDSGSFSVGGAKVKGLELQVGTLFTAGNFLIPVDLSYTYTDAETTSGDEYVSGQDLQNIPENIFSARIGLEHSSGWNNYAVAKYIDETCVSIGCNDTNSRFDRTDALFTMDLISRYQFSGGPEVFVKVENVFDRQEIIARQPFGARPNIERTVYAGVIVDF